MIVCANFPNPVLTPYTTASGKKKQHTEEVGASKMANAKCELTSGLRTFFLSDERVNHVPALLDSLLRLRRQLETGGGKNQYVDNIFCFPFSKVVFPPLL